MKVGENGHLGGWAFLLLRKPPVRENVTEVEEAWKRRDESDSVFFAYRS
jgi:hypothetical protein